MANLFLPQLTSGALAQYPIRKTRVFRTVKNVMGDGSMLLKSDPNGLRTIWNLEYVELSAADWAALQTHFNDCIGPFHAFTFIDPTGNMLAYSGDLTAPVWSVPASVQVTPNQVDPTGASAAFTLSNNGQAVQGLSQTLPVPAAYQYCFSVYVSSVQGANVTLSASGGSSNCSKTFAATAGWSRLILGSRLNDPSETLTVSLTLGPGQQATVYGPQLEAQPAPSRYHPTFQGGGVYTDAHFSSNQLVVIATAPGQFATSFSIETSI